MLYKYEPWSVRNGSFVQTYIAMYFTLIEPIIGTRNAKHSNKQKRIYFIIAINIFTVNCSFTMYF